MIQSPEQIASTRPYLLRALYEWCTDNGFTPYIAVYVDDTVRVPMEYVKNGEIVLNIGFDATSALVIGNDSVDFKARFAGVARDIHVPIDRVVAIYARENGQGMAFPVPQAVPARGGVAEGGDEPPPVPGPSLAAVPADGANPTPRPRTGKASLRLADDGEAASASEPGDGGAEPPVPPAPPKGGGKKPALKRVK
jgi:stringent starvation protein B